jgi:hypothetical protein
MLDAAWRQARHGWAVVTGKPVRVSDVRGLVGHLRATLAEFGRLDREQEEEEADRRALPVRKVVVHGEPPDVVAEPQFVRAMLTCTCRAGWSAASSCWCGPPAARRHTPPGVGPRDEPYRRDRW